jgi:hypothetical protein
VLEVPVGFYVEAGWDTDGEGRFWGREVGGVGGALGAKKDLKKEEKVPPLSWVKEIFGVPFSLPRKLRVGKGGGR